MPAGPVISLLRLRQFQLVLVMVMMLRQALGFGRSQALGRVVGAPSVRRSSFKTLSSPVVRPRSTRFFNAYAVTSTGMGLGACALYTTSKSDCDAPVGGEKKVKTVLGTERGTRDYWPPLQPNKVGRLKVSAIHELYWEESGNPTGKPVVFLHGGPGGGTNSDMRRYFDPAAYRIILFDQRGCGQSTPHANLEDNTTWDLVSDIEKLRTHLGVDKWMVFGGSWGSTLALTYAEEHPSRVTELVLRGIFMLRKKELQFYYQEGSSWVYPDYFEAFKNHIPKEEQHDIMQAYHRRLMSDDEEVQLAAAKQWTRWEMATSKLLPDVSNIDKADDAKFALAFARIENHFFVNKGWFSSDEHVLRNLHKIQHIPCVIVQGRYDVVCPMRSAWDVHKAWPASELVVVQDAGHSAAELGIKSELIKACDRFAGKKA